MYLRRSWRPTTPYGYILPAASCGEHGAQAPGRNRARRPRGKLCQGFPPREEGLHDDEPTEHETVTIFPETRHTTQKDGDEQGQRGDDVLQRVEVAVRTVFLRP